VTKAIAKNDNSRNSGSLCVFPVIWNPLKDALFHSVLCEGVLIKQSDDAQLRYFVVCPQQIAYYEMPHMRLRGKMYLEPYLCSSHVAPNRSSNTRQLVRYHLVGHSPEWFTLFVANDSQESSRVPRIDALFAKSLSTQMAE
jgi:hypothetical protein